MSIDPAIESFRDKGIVHWDQVARQYEKGRIMGWHYHRKLQSIYCFNIPAGLRVIELGCGAGDLLASVAPEFGVGVDFSPEMVRVAKAHHPGLIFEEADVMEYTSKEQFDVVILSDLVNNLFDVQLVLQKAHSLCKPRGRIIINFFSHLWEKPLEWARSIGLANLTSSQNWLTPADVKNMLYLTGWDTIRKWEDFVCPFNVPLLEPLCNRFLARIWPTKALCLTNFIIARPQPLPLTDPQAPSVSVIIPARNEAGNVEDFFIRTPRMGSRTELIIVEGHSTDNTYEIIEKKIKEHPEWNASLFRQTGKGKADAVRLGFEKAKCDILMILDADLTVVPEDLPRFYAALTEGRGEFINGVRLIYPMEGRAMRFLNLVGNKFFSLAFSWLLDQPIKDTLCGTKVLYKSDYESIKRNRSYFGDFDPFGDYDLLFGAAKLGLKIVDMPIRYRDRKYGDTNIHRWRHGLLLLKMVIFAARRIKFV
ncbi:MAG: glycosyl transferase [Lentisphaerae bacterium RIFOXYA12_FULL_48_11]|nr:MAG: glycosyl transferase [Lentisphaerae bacterium RIFOXYA12_FULL_48_11]